MQLKSQLYTQLKTKLFNEFITKVGKLHQQNFIYNYKIERYATQLSTLTKAKAKSEYPQTAVTPYFHQSYMNKWIQTLKIKIKSADRDATDGTKSFVFRFGNLQKVSFQLLNALFDKPALSY